MLGSLFSVRTTTAQYLPFLLYFRADAACLASLPLQFDSRELPGSLFLLTSHCRGVHLNKYVWALHTSASDGSTTRQSTWKWASVALFRSDRAPRSSLARHPNVVKDRDVYVGLFRVKQNDITRQTSTCGHLERQSSTAAAGNQSSSTWKHNRTISKTIDCITTLSMPPHTWLQNKENTVKFSDFGDTVEPPYLELG